MKKVSILLLILTTVFFCLGLFSIYSVGHRRGIEAGIYYAYDRIERQVERNSPYNPNDPPDPNAAELERLRQATQSWKAAAEHYGGICKWLLEGKPIYGQIVMDPNNAILRDCLIVSGSKDASVVINGESGLIMNNYFMAIDMDWVVSTTAVDPNEFDKKVMLKPE